jgi:hypothetical protein
MSARTDIKPWYPLPPAQLETAAVNQSDMKSEIFFANLDSSEAEAVSSLPQAQTKLPRKPDARVGSENKSPRTARLQENSGPHQRELLLSQIKRGEECLNQVRKDLETMRTDLEEWVEYERVCGRNPLIDYLQSISAKERIARFLPEWLKRQRDRLQNLERNMQAGPSS